MTTPHFFQGLQKAYWYRQQPESKPDQSDRPPLVTTQLRLIVYVVGVTRYPFDYFLRVIKTSAGVLAACNSPLL